MLHEISLVATSMIFCGAVLAQESSAPDSKASGSPSTSPSAAWSNSRVDLPGVAESTALQMSFGYPADFVIGRFAPEHTGGNRSLGNGIVLLESRYAADRDREKLKPGEVPMILVMRLGLPDMRPMANEAWLTRIGSHDVYKLPAVPAPFGEGMHAYLVKSDSGRDAMIWAHGKGADGRPTHYDWVIERMIASLRFTE